MRSSLLPLPTQGRGSGRSSPAPRCHHFFPMIVISFSLKENPHLTSCPFSSYCSISLLPLLAKPSEELPTPSPTISRKFSLPVLS